MANRGAALITEDDGPDDGGSQGAGNGLGSMLDMPDAPDQRPNTSDTTTNRSARSEAPADDDFEIVETDTDFRPLNREAVLSEDEGGERPLLEQRAAHETDEQHRQRKSKAEQRRSRQAGKQRSHLDNALLLARIAELESVVGDVVPRIGQIDEGRRREYAASLDRAIQDEQTKFTAAEQKLANSLALSAQGDEHAPKLVTEALRERDAAFLRGQQFVNQKNSLAATQAHDGADNGDAARERQPGNRQAPQARQAAEAPMDPVVLARVNDFQEDHPWFNQASEDPDEVADTRVMLRLDREVAADGFNPSSKAYWQELEARAREEIPERFKPAARETTRTTEARTQRPTASARQPAPQVERRGPMTGGSSDRAPTSTDKKVYLSPERKQALQLAGALDQDGVTITNKEKFTRIARKYQEWDKSNAKDARQ